MAGLKNKLGLSLDSAPRTHKKYLGEIDDPHYVPDSPLIDRQHFTAQEEGELRRICALALSQIPHSDDMNDDPFKYIVSQVQYPAAPKSAKMTASVPVKSTQTKQAPSQMPPFVPDPVDTATPSENSKRDTIDRTNYSTPLTSAGITPGETTKRFSDALRRPSTSKSSSNLKYESSQKLKTRAASSSHGVPRKPAETAGQKAHDGKPSKNGNATKHQSIKVVKQTPRASDAHNESAEIVRPVRFSQLELNKTLPALPRSKREPTEEPSASKFIKTLVKKKSQILEGRSVSASAASSPTPAAVSRFNSTLMQQPSATVRTQSAEQKQRKFKFSKLFGGRKESPTRVIVS